ncbi:peptidylprolyl isomerase [bacterium]|nr:MAG: peptidylprolyl isomerase [bacterium]
MVALAILPALAFASPGTVSQEPVTSVPVVAQAILADAAPGATAPKEGDEVAVLETSEGRIVLKFFPEKAPGHVKNFKKLAGEKFYDGTKFHRVIADFMIQGGDPLTKEDSQADRWGTGDPGYKIDAEFNDISHKRGILSMARSQDVNSAGSQFFICRKDSEFLDGKYSAFGQVVDGMKTVDKIATTPTLPGDRPKKAVILTTVKVEKWPLKS